MIETIFFDFDGVLTLNEDWYAAMSQEISKSSWIDFQDIKNSLSNYRLELALWTLTFEQIRWEFCKSVWLEMSLDDFYATIVPALPKNEEMFALARDLRRNWTAVWIITNNPQQRFDVLSDLRWISHTFSVAALPVHVWWLKNEKEIFEYALTEAWISAQEAIFIDNKEKNLRVPADLGFATFHFDTYLQDMDALTTFLATHDIDVSQA